MRKHFTYIAAVLLLLTGGLAGCKKDNDVTTSTGSISGKYSPARAAAGVVAIQISGTVSTNAKLDSSNGFSITGLEAGNYKIGFAAMPGFTAPDTVLVTVAAGKNADIGTVVFKPSATFGSISGKISPATAGTNISVKNSAGLVRYFGASDAAGNFKIDNVSPDLYELSFAPSLQFATPANVKATVTAGNNTDVGTIVLNPAGKKAIDTIASLLTFYTAADAGNFISRAAGDSAIVLLASFYVYQQALTPELLAAMNKIIVAKSIFQISGASGTLAVNGLKEAAQLSVIGGTNLTTLNLPSLSICGQMILRNCPLLTSVNISALTAFSSLEVNNTGLAGLTAFQSAAFKSFTLDIANNTKLTSLLGLNFVADSVYDCTITGNTLLTNLNGLQAVKRFTHETAITYNPVLQSLTGLDNAAYARRLTISNNPQLNSICAAKVLLNYLKDAPTFTEWQTNIDGQLTLVTRQPLVASANGSYATRADLVAAVGQCP